MMSMNLGSGAEEAAAGGNYTDLFASLANWSYGAGVSAVSGKLRMQGFGRRNAFETVHAIAAGWSEITINYTAYTNVFNVEHGALLTFDGTPGAGAGDILSADAYYLNHSGAYVDRVRQVTAGTYADLSAWADWVSHGHGVTVAWKWVITKSGADVRHRVYADSILVCDVTDSVGAHTGACHVGFTQTADYGGNYADISDFSVSWT